MVPIYCPFCSEQKLEELEPTEMFVDTDIWIIYHYECQSCHEIFDKVYLKEEEAVSDIDEDGPIDQNTYWS